MLSNTEIEYDSFDDEMYVEVAVDREIVVKKEFEEYIVEGEGIEKLLESVYFDDVDSLRHFQENLGKWE